MIPKVLWPGLSQTTFTENSRNWETEIETASKSQNHKLTRKKCSNGTEEVFESYEFLMERRPQTGINQTWCIGKRENPIELKHDMTWKTHMTCWKKRELCWMLCIHQFPGFILMRQKSNGLNVSLNQNLFPSQPACFRDFFLSILFSFENILAAPRRALTTFNECPKRNEKKFVSNKVSNKHDLWHPSKRMTKWNVRISF